MMRITVRDFASSENTNNEVCFIGALASRRLAQRRLAAECSPAEPA